jgi:hypothetical protein
MQNHENTDGNIGERFPTIHLSKIKHKSPGILMRGLFLFDTNDYLESNPCASIHNAVTHLTQQ